MFKLLVFGGSLLVFAVTGIVTGFSWKAHLIAAAVSLLAVYGGCFGVLSNGRERGMFLTSTGLLAIGLWFLAAGFFDWRDKREFVRSSQVVPGTVVENISSAPDDKTRDYDPRSVTFRPRIEYQDQSGKTASFVSNIG